MPFKSNAARRHHIPAQRQKVINWAEYDAGLRARGSLTVWFTAEAIAGWRAEARVGRGGQPKYSALAIATALTLQAVFCLTLRQTEGLIGSILQLLGLGLAVPDHSTLSRRAETLHVPGPKPGSQPVHLLADSTGLRLCGPGAWLGRSMLLIAAVALTLLNRRLCRDQGTVAPLGQTGDGDIELPGQGLQRLAAQQAGDGGELALLLAGLKYKPRKIVTDGLRSYGVAQHTDFIQAGREAVAKGLVSEGDWAMVRKAVGGR